MITLRFEKITLVTVEKQNSRMTKNLRRLVETTEVFQEKFHVVMIELQRGRCCAILQGRMNEKLMENESEPHV